MERHLSADGAVEVVLAAPSRRDAAIVRMGHTRGGPGAAQRRWRAYASRGGLQSCARHCNLPLAPDGKGGSRMVSARLPLPCEY